MSKFTDIPKFGVMSGMRLVIQAGSIAGPVIGTLGADYGADVIWLESTKAYDTSRNHNGMAVQQNHKNQRSLALDIPGEGRGVFLELMKTTDILVEANKGGQYEKWGITDELLWEINPKLVIVHISGFGQTGDPEYVKRPSYDVVAQAFSGFTYANTPRGEATRVPMVMTADFYTGLFAFGAAMAAYSNAIKTGKGESLDIAQYEVMIRFMDGFLQQEWNLPSDSHWIGVPAQYNNGAAGFSFFECADGQQVLIMGFGASVLPKVCQLLGLPYGTDEFPVAGLYYLFSPQGQKYQAALEAWCKEHTSDEVEKIMNELGVANCRNMEPRAMLTHPQYVARESIIKIPYHNGNGECYASNIVPKFKNNPGQVWRMAPAWGGDSRDILEDIGYTTEQIDELFEKKAISESEFRSLPL